MTLDPSRRRRAHHQGHLALVSVLVLVSVVALVGVLASCGASTPRPVPGTGTTLPSPAPGPPPTTLAPPGSSTTTTTAAPSTTAPPPPPSTSTAGPATVVYRASTTTKVVALTFDAGSDAGNAAEILSFLESHHIPATFGVTGLWATAHPDLVRRIATDGYQVVNHTWDHQSFTGYSTGTSRLSPAQQVNELSAAERVISQLTGAPAKPWFRPPYGDRDREVDTVIGAAGYAYELMWTVDTLGWKGVPVSTVVSRCLEAAGPGEIILMHIGSASTDAAALPSLVAGLEERGYGFSTVSAMAP